MVNGIALALEPCLCTVGTVNLGVIFTVEGWHNCNEFALLKSKGKFRSGMPERLDRYIPMSRHAAATVIGPTLGSHVWRAT